MPESSAGIAPHPLQRPLGLDGRNGDIDGERENDGERDDDGEREPKTRTATVTPAGGVSGEGDIMNTGMNWSLAGGDVLFEGNIHNNDGRDGVDG